MVMAVAVGDGHIPGRQIDGLNLSDEEVDAPDHFAERVHAVRGPDFPGDHFMKHGREEEEVVAADEDDLDVGVPSERLLQTESRVNAGKAAAENDNTQSLARRVCAALPEENHGRLLDSRLLWTLRCSPGLLSQRRGSFRRASALQAPPPSTRTTAEATTTTMGKGKGGTFGASGRPAIRTVARIAGAIVPIPSIPPTRAKNPVSNRIPPSISADDAAQTLTSTIGTQLAVRMSRKCCGFMKCIALKMTRGTPASKRGSSMTFRGVVCRSRC